MADKKQPEPELKAGAAGPYKPAEPAKDVKTDGK